MQLISRLSDDKTRRIPAIDRNLFEPIGELTVNFALLEGTVAHGIWLLLHPGNAGEQRTGQIVTAELSFRRLVEMLSCLYLHRHPDGDQEGLKQLRAKLFHLEEKRNTIIHSYWGQDFDSGQTTRLKTTAKAKGIVYQSEIVTRTDIEEIANAITELAVELENFYKSFG